MNDDGLFTIGALARRTGLTVKTIRFYSDTGIVPSTTRSPSGYRLYDLTALTRLELVRTLRDLGLELAVIRGVLDRDATVPEVAAAHADALDVQIRTLRLRRAVLRTVAGRGSAPEEIDLMHRLLKLSDEERRRLVHDFIDDTFGDLDANPEFVAMMRAAMPELPDDPEPEQIDAWAELAELTQDPDFSAAVRRMAAHQAKERAEGDTTGLHHDLTELVRDRVGEALSSGIAPESPKAVPIVAGLTAQYAHTFGRADDAALRHWLLDRLDVANDPRTERYWQLLSTINGWPVPPSLAPVFTWLTTALRSLPGPSYGVRTSRLP
ncbi:MerR family transcriptional regulator [Streptomyces spiroverticillatus]|uniref:MerR family transcriptional regulator n=1 Tax=Streptomyces finlayi TaxID=67296 RepID=A0A919CCG0_9ACTN|nr:MerR family transcriptional regulator [Streptomyces finlayi]GHA23224.1 MerR family transcriptional regulator [Streptomyces spiroverticillatus]GHD04742.1 MerR family transcriptional regulator [Streptomyces finlayi]